MTHDDLMARQERFKACRKHINETCKKAGDAIGVSPAMISELESSPHWRDISYKNAAAIAKHYGVDVVWLMEGEQPQTHEAPEFITEDLVPVVRCEDCAFRMTDASGVRHFCFETFRATPDDFYCAYGKRKENCDG